MALQRERERVYYCVTKGTGKHVPAHAYDSAANIDERDPRRTPNPKAKRHAMSHALYELTLFGETPAVLL